MKRLAPLAAVVLLLVAPSAVRAEDAQPFVTKKDVHLTMILPPPPANDSAEIKAELGEVLTLQVTRTPEMEKRAIADAEEDVWRFADVMGPKFSKETLPKFSAFFDRVVATEGAVVDPAKDVWKRPRPHQRQTRGEAVEFRFLALGPCDGRHHDGHHPVRHGAGEAGRDHGPRGRICP